MTNFTNKDNKAKKSSENKDEIEELKIFISRIKVQNVALKKIIAKLITDENHTNK